MSALLLILTFLTGQMTWTIETSPVSQMTEFNLNGGMVKLPSVISQFYTCIYTKPTQINDKTIGVALICLDRYTFGRFVSIETLCRITESNTNSETLKLNARIPFVYQFSIKLKCMFEEF